MQYKGSKRLLKKELIPILTQYRGDKPFIDMFTGGANLVDGIKGGKIIANDINTKLIAMWQKLQDGWQPPKYVTKKEYYEVKEMHDKPHLQAYVGFCSFGSKYFGGYPNTDERRTSELYWLQHYNFLMRQLPLLKDVQFTNHNYKTFPFDYYLKGQRAIIYCDKPYEDTDKYTVRNEVTGKNMGFDHDAFWEWVRKTSIEQRHIMYVSEYNAPPDFTKVWEKKVTVGLSTTKAIQQTEKLFRFIH